MIESLSLDVERRAPVGVLELTEAIAAEADGRVVRWSISRVEEERLSVEVSRLAGADAEPADLRPSGYASPLGQTAVVNVVPTGIGCAIGGFAADAGPATALLAACVDHLIANPNAVNGSDLIHAPRNLVYAEGFFVDNFLAGRVDLLLPRSNRIGVVLGQDEEWKLEHAMNVVNAVRAVHGIEVVAVEVTGARVGARCVRTRSGAYAGALADEGPLLDACRRVLDRGATAIAIASSVEDLPQRAYARHFAGDEPNPVGGAEAVISHLVSSAFGIPAAHAPLVNFRDVELESPIVDARGAAELISVSGLASVLIGLHRAPQARPGVAGTLRGAVSLRDVVAVVAPASALGGPPVLHAVRHGIPVIAVRGNHTILDVTAAALGIDVVEVENYAEAAGVVVALREGIGVGRLLRPLATLDFRSAPARARDGVRQ